VRAAREATDRAETAEARAAVLGEKLSSADVQVKMLRAQLHKLQEHSLAPLGLGQVPAAHRGLHGKLYHAASNRHPARLPKIGGGHEAGGALGGGAPAKRPPMDLRTLEEGFCTAFPDVGVKSRSGLHARPSNYERKSEAKPKSKKAKPPADIYVHVEESNADFEDPAGRAVAAEC